MRKKQSLPWQQCINKYYDNMTQQEYNDNNNEQHLKS